jgi:kynurenine formamidase
MIARIVVAVAVLALPALAHAQASSPLSLKGVRVVDLTHAFDERTIYWPTSPSSFELDTLSHGTTPGGWFYSANRICTPEHGGTHLDAPIHFAEGTWSADQIPVDRLVGPAVVIDVSSFAEEDPDFQLRLADVRRWEEANGRIPQGAIVMLHTGWGTRWPDRKRYLGDDTPGDASRLHFPSYGVEAARFLVDTRKVVVLGVDTASIDPGNSKDFPVHRLAGAANVSGLENVANLDQVPATGAWIVALPMKIAGGSGGPARIVALMR